MATSLDDVLEVIADFDVSLAETDAGDRKQTIHAYLQKIDKINFLVPDFTPGLEWLNVSEPLTFSNQLKSRIVVLDFFTYCCINCMHILPDLEVVEKWFPPQSGVVVVGVHSAKFLNEKVTANILSAILRYNIHHPVVNDKDADMWQTLSVACWPTLVFVGPAGQLLYSLAGEGHRAWILEFLQEATEYYSSQLRRDSIKFSLEKDKTPESSLCFPGKVCYFPERNWLVISDTGNHRIIATDMSGVVQTKVGSGIPGLKDGNFLNAEFSSPQGVACDKKYIYVADTGNHCLRKIDMELNTVVTIVGTGFQGTDKQGGKQGKNQEISSPWDVVLGVAPDSSPVLFIAMAGTHQIWVYFLNNSTWYRGRSYDAGICVNFAGSGQEENRNNSYAEKAGFAQPSGLAISSKDPKNRLYVADSESSSIRAVSLVNCAVTGIVGGERDPRNLFAFGDIDGKGIQAKLQHPLGVAYLDGKLIVADSYNHKIKIVDLDTLICQTYAGTGQPGSTLLTSDLSSCEFNEPGGVAVNETENLIYVADTNNQAIKVIDYNHKTIFQLPIVFPDEVDTNIGSTVSMLSKQESIIEVMLPLPDVTLPLTSATVTLTVPLNLSEGTHINTDAPNSWKICGLDESSKQLWDSVTLSDQKGKFHSFINRSQSCKGHASMTITLPQVSEPGVYTFRITVQIFVCLDEDNACLPPDISHFKQVLIFK